MREQRKMLSLFLALTLLISLLYPMPLVGANPEPVEENVDEITVTEDSYGTEPSKEITENILTDVKLTFYENETSDEEVERVDRETIIKVEYKWALPDDRRYKSGATYQFQLPEELVVYEEVNESISSANGQTIGTFQVALNGTVTIVFNEFIEQHSNISGTLEVLTKINETIVIEEGQKVTITPIKDRASIEIPIHVDETLSTIDKRGTLVTEDGTEQINWTVDFNKTLATIENTVFSDPIQDGQELEEGSVKVYELLVRLDGSVERGREITEFEIEKIDGDKDFKINFGPINSAYQVTFTTKITDSDKTTYRNEATLSGANIEDLEASATVSIDRGTPLEKRSAHYDEATQTITWEIKYNYNKKHILKDKAWLEDFFNGSQELIEDSFEVKEITIGENGQEVETDFEDYTLTPETKEENGKQQNGFRLQFNQDINSAYKITYKTKATKRVFENDRITNKVESGTGEKDEKHRDIRQGILVKEHTGANYSTKIATWRITFNKDNYEMNEVVLKDVFPNGGLTLMPETLLIKDSEGNELTEGPNADYTLDEETFTITFHHPINKEIVITYETYFEYDERIDPAKEYLENEAILTWTDEENKPQEKRAQARFTPDNYTKLNGYKSGSYNAVTKEITWEIGVNYNLVPLKDAQVIDYMLDGQQFLEDTLEVYEMKLTGKPNGIERGKKLTLGSEYEVENITDESGNQGFEVTILGESRLPYLITFKTSLKDQLIKKEYKNTAKLHNNNELQADLDASVSIPYGDEYTKKTGKQNGKIVDWRVNINFGQSKVSDAKVFDTPSENHRLLENSFQLFATSVAENGTVTKGTELVKGEDYTLEFMDNGGFELTFLRDINDPFILEYQSLILAKVGEIIENVVKFSGNGIETEKTRSESSVRVTMTTGIGSGRGEVGSLVITKVDAEDETPLAGAEFTLIDQHTKAVIDTVTTGDDGKATFNRLLYGDYLLKESKAPEGYVVKIADQGRVKVDANPTELTIENEKILQAVKLIKVDKDDPTKTLEGAEFELQRKDGANFVKVSEHRTNDQGEIVINELPAGEYRFVETKAPEHYLFDSDNPLVKEFTIKENQTTIEEITAENERGKGKLILTKVDAADPETKLEGAVFKLYNSANELIDTKTSGADGQVVFDNLPYDRYTLREITAPANYIIDITEEEREILIDKPLTEQTIKNQKLERSFKLIKVDASNKNRTLEGAVFELRYKAPGSSDYIVIGTEKLTTDANGEIIVKDLPIGDYQLIEITAPRGYILDSTPIEFSIDKEQIKILELTKENKRRSSGGGGGGGNPPDNGDKDDPDPPKEEEPESPVDPEKSVDPETPVDPEQPVDPETPVNPEQEQSLDSVTGNVSDPADEDSDSDANASQNKKQLPKTGESLPWTPFLGMLLLIAAFLLWFRKGRIQG